MGTFVLVGMEIGAATMEKCACVFINIRHYFWNGKVGWLGDREREGQGIWNRVRMRQQEGLI